MQEPATKMKSSEFARGAPGRLVETGEGAKAFVPDPMPASLQLPDGTIRLLGEARAALGRLGEGGKLLPNPSLFISPLQKQEAVLSNRIEGTRTTLEEALVDEASESSSDDEDLEEVRNYSLALESGHLEIGRGRKLTVGLILELHAQLLRGVRGKDKTPGAFRTIQVWLGGVDSKQDIHKARFVPPPAHEVRECMQRLEDEVSRPTASDPLIRIALTHYQFETIHPFQDGNGRLGRLIISLQVLHEKLLERPWLYLSPYFEAHKESYTSLLYRVSARGDYMAWIEFFLSAVRESAQSTVDKIRSLYDLDRGYREKLGSVRSQNPVRLLETLQRVPALTVPKAMAELSVTANTASTAIQHLVEAGVLEEVSWKMPTPRGRHPKVFICRDILNLIES